MRFRLAALVVGSFALAFPLHADIQGTTWFPMGPAPIDGFFKGGATGRASAIAVNPMNPDEIWLGTASGGVWHSRNGGVDFEPETDREDGLAIGAIALDGCTASGCARIFVGTGENAIRRDTYYGAGLLVGGETGGEISIFVWTHHTGSPFDFRRGSINDVVLDPDTTGPAKRVFVTLSSGTTVAAPESTVTAPAPGTGFGIYRSDDAGATFAQLVVAGSDGARPTDLEMAPTPQKHLFAGFTGRGVFRSTNGGDTWCPLNEGITLPGGCPDASGLPVADSGFDFVEIAIAPGAPSVVYASFGMCPDRLLQSCEPAIYRSADDGLTWTLQRASNPNPSGDACTAQAQVYSRYTHGLAVDPTNENVLLLGGLRIWRSTNGGTSFTASDATASGVAGGGSPVVHLDHREIAFHVGTPSRVYSTGDGGFATSTNGGTSWTPRNDDLQITGFHGIGSSPRTGAVIGTSQDNSGQLWFGSRRWRHMNCCGDGGFSFLDFDDPMRLYAASNFGSPMRSTDGGSSWGWIGSGIGSSDPRLFYAPFVQAPTESSPGVHALYFGSNRLYRSMTDGTSWTPVSPVLATGSSDEIVTAISTAAHVASPVGTNVISAIGIAPGDPNRVYVGYYLGQLFRSNPAPCDTADCWTPAGAGLPAAPVTGIAVDPTDWQRVIVTLSGFGAFEHVWRTTNGGASWTPAVTGLPAGVPANTVAFEVGPPKRAYLGLDSGPDGVSVFRSTDGGASWSAFGDGLPNVPVFQFSVNETFGRIYAGTHGRGAFVLGRPFISNFEGWVHDRIWDIPVYGQNFLPNQSCTMQVLQSNGTSCGSASTDVMGGAIRTDSGGVLETSKASMWNGRKVVWACYNGKCLGNTPIAGCYDDADGDGDPDPLSSIRVVCGADLATARVIGCPPLDNPPSTIVEVPDAPGGGGTGGLCAPTPSGVTASDVTTPSGVATASGVAAGATPAPLGRLYLTASVQRRVGTQSLCTVTVPYWAADSAATILGRAQDLLNASPTCSANGIRAVLEPGTGGPSEDEFPRPPRLRLEAPTVVGGQLVTALHTDPGGAVGRCLTVGGLGVPVLNQIHVLALMLRTPPEGAAGGSLTVVEDTPVGSCSITVPTVAGQSAAVIAAAVEAAFQAPGIPGPHPACPADYNPRDLSAKDGTLITVFAQGVTACSEDPKLGFDLRSEELLNVHPVADAGDDRAVPSGDPIVLDASLSADPDSVLGTNDDITQFEWLDVTGGTPVVLGSGETLTLPVLPDGLRRFRLRVTDKAGLSDLDDVMLSVGGDVGGGGGFAGAAGAFAGSVHLGSTHPVGSSLGGMSDANVHARVDVGYAFTDTFRLQGILGISQLTAESAGAVEHPRWINLSLNGQLLFPLPSGIGWLYMQGGPGVYHGKDGADNFGFNLGVGLRYRLRAPVELEIGADYHRINNGFAGADVGFVSLQLGVLFR